MKTNYLTEDVQNKCGSWNFNEKELGTGVDLWINLTNRNGEVCYSAATVKMEGGEDFDSDEVQRRAAYKAVMKSTDEALNLFLDREETFNGQTKEAQKAAIIYMEMHHAPLRYTSPSTHAKARSVLVQKMYHKSAKAGKLVKFESSMLPEEFVGGDDYEVDEKFAVVSDEEEEEEEDEETTTPRSEG